MKIEWGPPPALCTAISPLQQHPNYAAALILMGAKVVLATINDTDGHTLATAQFILRQPCNLVGLAMLPRGPIWHKQLVNRRKQAALSLLTNELPIHGVRTLISNTECPRDDMAFCDQGHVKIITSQHVAEIDLIASKEERLAAQSVKWRNRLRAAQKTHLKITHYPFPDTPNHFLLQSETKQRKAKKYRALPNEFTISYARANPKDTRLFTATLNGEIVAAMLFLLHGKTATYHIGWTNTSGRHLNAHNLLIWNAANWLSQKGFFRLDLGTVDTESSPGLARFKIGTGARIRVLGGTWLHTPLTAAAARFMAHIPPLRHHYHKSV